MVFRVPVDKPFHRDTGLWCCYGNAIVEGLKRDVYSPIVSGPDPCSCHIIQTYPVSLFRESLSDCHGITDSSYSSTPKTSGLGFFFKRTKPSVMWHWKTWSIIFHHVRLLYIVKRLLLTVLACSSIWSGFSTSTLDLFYLSINKWWMTSAKTICSGRRWWMDPQRPSVQAVDGGWPPQRPSVQAVDGGWIHKDHLFRP